MRPLPSRRRNTSPSRARLKAPNALPDVLWTSLSALQQSSDAFPPLKSAVAGAVAICTIVERTKHSQSDARALALRIKDILDVLADAVPDGNEIPSTMISSIAAFSKLLREIEVYLKKISASSKISRLIHLNRNENLLTEYKAQLDYAYRDFLAASTLRLEVQQAELAICQRQLILEQKAFSVRQLRSQAEIRDISSKTDGVLFYSRLICFFGPPLMLPYNSHHNLSVRTDTHRPMLAGQRARGDIWPTSSNFFVWEPRASAPKCGRRPWALVRIFQSSVLQRWRTYHRVAPSCNQPLIQPLIRGFFVFIVF
ncbi:hypothetical protein R3P38DRAFT_2857852 [Favolaschia claudopus]|uniref:Fungal N-terminal domain-containing protein n=1 Tax=Favolaschia claudopus TaxID=2862362 RepID=A0AAW0DJD1_9AGAR